MTFGRDDEVVCMTTSADCSKTSLASPETRMPHGASAAPTTSPRSLPTLEGSVSMAPTRVMASFSRSNFTMDAPMGPTPYWMARIFFFTVVSDSFLTENAQSEISLGANLPAYWNPPGHSIRAPFLPTAGSQRIMVATAAQVTGGI